MVEVVGTAPTSAMVITKFVYRRSWQANTINIKTILRDSTKIMKLTKEQSQEIKAVSYTHLTLPTIYSV